MKRILTLLLTLTMLISSLTVMATETTDLQPEEQIPQEEIIQETLPEDDISENIDTEENTITSDVGEPVIEQEEPTVDSSITSESIVEDSQDTVVSSVYEDSIAKMREIYAQKSLVSEGQDDVSCFWDMLAKSALNGIEYIEIDYNNFCYTTMPVQKTAKLLIAAVNNGDIDKVVETAQIIKVSQEEDGSFNNTSITDASGNPFTVYATDQVWAIIALEIADEDYNRDKAFEFLLGCQNEDKGLGYGSWSDVGTTAWAITCYQLAGMDIPQTLLDYVEEQWSTLVGMKDSSSMSAFISTKLASEEKLNNMLESYHSDGYFSWGDDTEINEYSTGTCSQALADYSAEKSIYAIYDDTYVKTVSEPEDTTPDIETPEDIPTGDITPEPTVPPTDISDEEEPTGSSGSSSAPIKKTIQVEVTIETDREWISDVIVGVKEGSTVLTALKQAMDDAGITYNIKNNYISSITKNGETFGERMTAEGLDGLIFYVNGKKATKGANQVKVSEGDAITLKYVVNYLEEDAPKKTSPSRGTTTTKKETKEEPKEEVAEKQEETKLEIVLPEDSKGHWAEESLKVALSKGIIKGYNDGSLKPNGKITRAEFVTLLFNLFGEDTKVSTSFKDVTDTDWYSASVTWATGKGYISGFDGKFNPNLEISRQDMAVIISRIVGTQEGEGTSFDDMSEASEYAEDAIINISKSKLIEGFDGKFNPTANLTRAEAIVIILRIGEKLNA